MIDDHFFYLKNRRTDSKAQEAYLLFRKKHLKSKVFTHPGYNNELSIQCYFDENEELLKLVCLFAEMYYNSSSIIKSPLGRKISVLDFGKELEFNTFAAFLESSHFNDKEKSILLEGVGIKEFLRNLLTNFDKGSEGFRSSNIKLKLN